MVVGLTEATIASVNITTQAPRVTVCEPARSLITGRRNREDCGGPSLGAEPCRRLGPNCSAFKAGCRCRQEPFLMGAVSYGFVELLAGHSLLMPGRFPASQIKIPADFADDC